MLHILERYDEEDYETLISVLEELDAYLPTVIETEVINGLIHFKGTNFFLMKEETPV